ncbi:hypothetical protein NX059_012261 [Plenodomus lindquistii]|nr:hypothetical protein NX059_012261 [Plenodomus lindquistii]
MIKDSAVTYPAEASNPVMSTMNKPLSNQITLRLLDELKEAWPSFETCWSELSMAHEANDVGTGACAKGKELPDGSIDELWVSQIFQRTLRERLNIDEKSA